MRFSVISLIRAMVLIFLFCFYHCCEAQSLNATTTIVELALSAHEPDNTLLGQSIRKVDSLSHKPGMAMHFAGLYTESMKNIGVQLTRMDSSAQAFVKRFEVSFIGYFLEAAKEYEETGSLERGSVWDCYFTHRDVQPWQLTLVGVNAHINGDIWKGLVANFTLEEIRLYKKNLLSFQSSISWAFRPFFNELLDKSAYLRFINAFSKGAAILYGDWLIYFWRLRQVNLALLYFKDQERFRKKLKAIHKKRMRIDRFILRKKRTELK